MQGHLSAGRIAMHPFVVAELALGTLRDRKKTLAYLEMLPQVKVAQLSEVRRMIEAHSLYGRGIGLTDVHLLASALITPYTLLWTVDKRLGSLAEALGVLHK
jgi:hypothetical protein